MKHKVWFWALIFVLVFGGCGAATSPQDIVTPVSAQTEIPQPTPKIRYHTIDDTTTVFMPDEDFPIVCIYVESLKIAEHRVDQFFETETILPAVYTSGLSCVLINNAGINWSDDWVERYPTK